MPLLEYVLLAILGAAPPPAPAGTSSGPTATFAADSVAQPNGGSPVAVVTQKKPLKEPLESKSKSARHHTRRHHKARTRRSTLPQPQPDSKVKQ